MKRIESASMKEKWKAVRANVKEAKEEETKAESARGKEKTLTGTGGALSFVVHEHHATHLHWDFRLEMDGALRSWAVPKGPPTVDGVRRLAVETEEHALEYGGFEGEIPEGQYGAGQVIIWDKGTYEAESVHEDKIVFVMNGAKMKGRYCLIRMLSMGPKNWLLFKMKDKEKKE